MNKKGIVFSITMVIVTMIALTTAYMVISKKIDRLPSYQIGEKQFSLLDNYQNAYDSLNEIDDLASTSTALAILDLAGKGGFNNPSVTDDKNGFYGQKGCGDYMGFPIWNKGDDVDSCMPDINEEFQDAFNSRMRTSLWQKGIQINIPYEITIKDGEYSSIVGVTKSKISYLKAVRSDSVIADNNDYLLPAEDVTSYSDCTALYIYDGKTDKGKTCAYTTSQDFSDFVSFNSPYLIFVANEKGNAVQRDFGEMVIELAQAWNQKEGGKSALGLYSVSTGQHSCTSKHNLGLAVDISGCYDKDGVYHDAKKQTDPLFQECEDFIKYYWMFKGTFISYRNCIVASGADCATKSTLIQAHSNHIHIQEG